MDQDKKPAEDKDALVTGESLKSQDDSEPSPDQMALPGKEMKTKRPRFNGNKKMPSPKKMAAIFLIILLIGGGGFVAWKFLINADSEEPPATLQPDEAQQQSTAEETETSPLSEEYSSSELRMDFMYPSGWEVSEGAGGIKVESPEFSYTTTDGSETDGNFRIYLRQGAREVDSKYIGRGVAIKPSEKLSYNNPAPGQRKNTFLSSFGLDNSDNFNFFMVAGNFDLKKGDTLGPTFGRDDNAYIVAGGYSNKDLSEDLQMNPVSTDTYEQTAAYKEAIEIIKSLQLK